MTSICKCSLYLLTLHSWCWQTIRPTFAVYGNSLAAIMVIRSSNNCMCFMSFYILMGNLAKYPTAGFGWFRYRKTYRIKICVMPGWYHFAFWEIQDGHQDDHQMDFRNLKWHKNFIYRSYPYCNTPICIFLWPRNQLVYIDSALYWYFMVGSTYSKNIYHTMIKSMPSSIWHPMV